MAESTGRSVRSDLTFSVIVPTYRRTAELQRCLAALEQQTRSADEIIVIVRDTDAETMTLLRQHQSSAKTLKAVEVCEVGVVAAMNAGLRAAAGDLIALTDDDAAPWPDWLARMEVHFTADEQLGGVGGRDWVYHDGKLDDGPPVADAGKMSWFGRVMAGHHLAAGSAREVCVLKGVNSAYRAAPLRQFGFDTRMAGSGAQVHWELALGLAMRRAGWRLLLDPSIGVDHYPAVRYDEDQRRSFNAVSQRNAVANETLVIFEHLRGPARAAFLMWAAIVGTRGAPGLLQVPRLVVLRGPRPIHLWWATLRGRLAGLKTFFKTPRHSNAKRIKSPQLFTGFSSGVHL